MRSTIMPGGSRDDAFAGIIVADADMVTRISERRLYPRQQVCAASPVVDVVGESQLGD